MDRYRAGAPVGHSRLRGSGRTVVRAGHWWTGSLGDPNRWVSFRDLAARCRSTKMTRSERCLKGPTASSTNSYRSASTCSRSSTAHANSPTAYGSPGCAAQPVIYGLRPDGKSEALLTGARGSAAVVDPASSVDRRLGAALEFAPATWRQVPRSLWRSRAGGVHSITAGQPRASAFLLPPSVDIYVARSTSFAVAAPRSERPFVGRLVLWRTRQRIISG